MGDTQIDVTTLLIGLAVCVIAVSLAQLTILVIATRMKKNREKNISKEEYGYNDKTPGGVK